MWKAIDVSGFSSGSSFEELVGVDDTFEFSRLAHIQHLFD